MFRLWCYFFGHKWLGWHPMPERPPYVREGDTMWRQCSTCCQIQYDFETGILK